MHFIEYTVLKVAKSWGANAGVISLTIMIRVNLLTIERDSKESN